MTATVIAFPRMLRADRPAVRDWSPAYTEWRVFMSRRLVPCGLFVVCQVVAALGTFGLGWLCGWV